MVIQPEHIEAHQTLNRTKSKGGRCYDASGQLIVPVVDLSKSEEECVATAREACETIGFFYLAGHGVPQHVMDNVLKAALEFFRKPSATKAKFRTDLQPLGYKHGTEDKLIADKTTQASPETREHFRTCKKRTFRDFNACLHNKELQNLEDDEDILWCAEDELQSEWKADVRGYLDAVVEMVPKLHRVLALSLGLPPTYFKQYFDRAMDFIIFHRYFPSKSDPGEGKLGLGQHTDFGMTTILLTNGVSGLQVCKDKSKPLHAREWIDVPQRQGMFIVNVGDMLEHWSNGRYLSNLHRVVNQTGEERISVALFGDPNAMSLITPINGTTDKYEAVVYGEFLKKRFNQISEAV